MDKSLLNELEKIEQEELENLEKAVIPPENIFAYIEQRSCADIERMIKDGSLCEDPFYQRGEVWKNPQQSRFIDSLLKRLPIPSLCISADYKEDYNVIDGKQRITTILKFLRDDNWRISDLSDIDARISGKSVAEIKIESPQIYSAIKNLTLPINMIRCDYDRPDNMDYIFTIFHRLNTGGVSLNNQEIRHCIFSGEFINFLTTCNNNETWKKWIPSISNNDRMRGEERILSFFAFYYNLEEYNGKLNSFLNDFALKYRKSSSKWLNAQNLLFKSVVSIASKINLKYKNNIYIDAVLYGIANNLETCKSKSNELLQQNFEKLIKTPSFSSERIREGTSRKEYLIDRLQQAKEIFGE